MAPNAFDTRLSPQDEAQFRAWLKATGRSGDLSDYDLRGAWAANIRPDERGHLPDTYKKPNHPTFSDESQYADAKTPGGTWSELSDGTWAFFASPTNLKGRDPSALLNYFQAVEPGNAVVLPKGTR